MKSMREGMKSVMWAVAIAFVASLFFVGANTLRKLIGGHSSAVLVIDGRRIEPAQFEAVVRRDFVLRARRFQEESKRPPTDDEREQLRLESVGAAVNQLVQRELIGREAARMGLRVTDEDVRVVLEHNPAYQEEGKFNPRKYERAIREETGLTTGEFEAQVRDYILMDKVAAVVGGAARVSVAEARAKFNEENEKVRVEYAFLPAAPAAGAAPPGPGELEAYYRAHADRYHVGARARVKYCLVSLAEVRKKIKLTDAQVKEYYERHKSDHFNAGEIHVRHLLVAVPPGSPEAAWEQARVKAAAAAARVRAGEDFAAVAAEVSDDPASGRNGGDLGWAARGRFDPDFEAVAFALKEGELSDPVKTVYGYHIIRREPDVPPFATESAAIRQMLTERAADEQTRTIAFGLRDRLIKAKGKADFDAEAKALNLKPTSPPPFEAAAVVEGLGYQRQLAEEAFTLDAGAVGSVVPVADFDPASRSFIMRGYVVYQLVGTLGPGAAPYDFVKADVAADYARDKALDAAAPGARAVYDAARKNGDLKAAAAAAKGSYAVTGDFTRRTPPLAVGSEYAFVDAAFRAPAGTVAGPVRTARGYYIVKVAAKTPADPALFATQGDAFRAQLEKVRRQKFVDEWFRKLVASAKIEKNYAAYLQGNGPAAEGRGRRSDNVPVGLYY
jgi:peptidyl-prolyl cis-trans isomerase D